jgi:phenylalanine-4-hydroxylase
MERSPLPDLLHDVWGHLPLLFDAEYSTYLKTLASFLEKAPSNLLDDMVHKAQVREAELEVMLPDNPAVENELCELKPKLTDLRFQLAQNPSYKTYLSRIFLWTIEFGLIGNQKEHWIIGAGILSSFKEMISAIKRKPMIEEYSMEAINEDFNFVGIQDKLYVSKSINHYIDVLTSFQTTCANTF